MCRSHQHGGRNTLATDVADAEEQLLVADEVVEEVATNLFGREQHAVDVNVGALLVTHLLGQHLHLDAAGYAQLAVDALLRSLGVLQFFVVLDEVADDESQDDDGCQIGQQDGTVHLP